MLQNEAARNIGQSAKQSGRSIREPRGKHGSRAGRDNLAEENEKACHHDMVDAGAGQPGQPLEKANIECLQRLAQDALGKELDLRIMIEFVPVDRPGKNHRDLQGENEDEPRQWHHE